MKAFCTLDCSGCPLFKTENKNYSLKEKESIARNWSELMGVEISTDELHCEGCKSGNLFVHCVECRFRDCCEEKGVEFCSDCEDYPCTDISNFTQWFELNREKFMWND